MNNQKKKKKSASGEINEANNNTTKKKRKTKEEKTTEKKEQKTLPNKHQNINESWHIQASFIYVIYKRAATREPLYCKFNRNEPN